MKESNESINELERKIDKRDKWTSYSGYEDDLDQDYGYESSYHKPYDTHQFPYPHYKECLTISSKPMSKYQTQ